MPKGSPQEIAALAEFVTWDALETYLNKISFTPTIDLVTAKKVMQHLVKQPRGFLRERWMHRASLDKLLQAEWANRQACDCQKILCQTPKDGQKARGGQDPKE